MVRFAGLVVLLEWMVSAWADRASGDEAANRRIRNRIMYPLEIPVFGAIGMVLFVERDAAPAIVQRLIQSGEAAAVMGEVQQGPHDVQLV